MLISASISTKHGSTFDVSLNDERSMLSIEVQTFLEPCGGDPIPYDTCEIHFHGSAEDLCDLARRIHEAAGEIQPAPVVETSRLAAGA